MIDRDSPLSPDDTPDHRRAERRRFLRVAGGTTLAAGLAAYSGRGVGTGAAPAPPPLPFPTPAPAAIPVSSVSNYEPETEALVATFTVPPTTRRKKTINDAILTLKTRGVWSRIRLFAVTLDTLQQTTRNWKAPGHGDLAVVGRPHFMANIGIGSFSTASYLRSGILLSSVDPADCYIGFYPNGAAPTAYADVGAIDASGNGLSMAARQASNFPGGQAGGQYIAKLHPNPAAWLGAGWVGIGRRPIDPGKVQPFRGPVNRGAVPSIAAPSMGRVEVVFGGVNNNGLIQPANNSQFAWVIASGLTDDEQKVIAGVVQELKFEFTHGELDSYPPGTEPLAVHYDVIVHGATSAGVAAAVELKRRGLSVAIAGDWRERVVGGMSSGGLGAVDCQNIAGVGGLPLWILREAGGISRVMNPENFRGVMHRLLDPSQPNGQDIPVYWTEGVVSAARSGRRYTSFSTADGRTFSAKCGFIDASYASDLLRVMGLSLAFGREPRSGAGAESRNGFAGLASEATSQYRGHQVGAPINVDPFVVPGNSASGLLPGIAGILGLDTPALGARDDKTQAFNFRIGASLSPAVMIPWPATQPPGYSAARYEALGRWLAKDPLLTIMDVFNPAIVMGAGDQLYDWNNHAGLSTDMMGSGTAFQKAASYAEREIVWKQIENYTRGLIYYLTYENDARVAGTAIRTAMLGYGLHMNNYNKPHPNDDFNWMSQLYIRGLYRLVGDFVWTADDVAMPDGSTPRSTNTIATGFYYMDTHANAEYADHSTGIWRIWKEGNVDLMAGGGTDHITPIPMEVVMPKAAEAENVLTPWAISASALAFSVARMELSFMQMGQSCACIMALRAASGNRIAVQKTDYSALRRMLMNPPAFPGETVPVLPQVN